MVIEGLETSLNGAKLSYLRQVDWNTKNRRDTKRLFSNLEINTKQMLFSYL